MDCMWAIFRSSLFLQCILVFWCITALEHLTIAPKQAAMNVLLDALHPAARIVVRTPSTKLLAVIRPCKPAWKDFGKPEKNDIIINFIS